MGDMPAPPLSFTLFGLASLYNKVAAIDVAVIAGNDEAVVVEAQSLGFSRNTVQSGAEQLVARLQISTRQAGVARKAEDLIEPAPADGCSLSGQFEVGTVALEDVLRAELDDGAFLDRREAEAQYLDGIPPLALVPALTAESCQVEEAGFVVHGAVRLVEPHLDRLGEDEGLHDLGCHRRSLSLIDSIDHRLVLLYILLADIEKRIGVAFLVKGI